MNCSKALKFVLHRICLKACVSLGSTFITCGDFRSHRYFTSSALSVTFSFMMIKRGYASYQKSSVPHTCCMLSPRHCPLFYDLNNSLWGIQTTKVFLHSHVTSSFLRRSIFLSRALFSNTLSLNSSINVTAQVTHSQKKWQIIIIIIFIL